MLSIFKNKDLDRYKKLIKGSFPSSLSKDVETVISILPLKDKKIVLCDGKIHEVDNLIHEDFQEVILEGETLNMAPYKYWHNYSID
jgi:hypothetical protein